MSRGIIWLEKRFRGLGFGVWGLGFGVWGLGFGVWVEMFFFMFRK